MRTNKRLGQYFLADKSKIEKIVDALEIKNGDVVVEIGPGRGGLTKTIIQKFGDLAIKDFDVFAIEKDEKLYEELNNSVSKKLKIICGDALKILPKLITELPNYPITDYKLVGNIPYYITGRLFRILGEIQKKPELVVLTIQREVAERVTANPPKMNLLAASVQFWAEIEIIDFIGKKSFRPSPKVDSAIVRLKPFPRSGNENKKYYEFIKILFRQPRKTILNNLETGCRLFKKELAAVLEKMDINYSKRPQNLTLFQIKDLAEIYQKIQSEGD